MLSHLPLEASDRQALAQWLAAIKLMLYRLTVHDEGKQCMPRLDALPFLAIDFSSETATQSSHVHTRVSGRQV